MVLEKNQQQKYYLPAQLQLKISQKNINGERIHRNIVLINNKQWMSCISNKKVENWTNSLHEDYIESDAYNSLFF